MRPSTSLLPLLALPALALSQLDTFRATVEGSLHQCQSSQLFFFDSGDARPLSVLFLPSASIPAAARNGTVLLQDALGYSPMLALGDITAADASGWDFEVQVAAGTEFEVRAGVGLAGGGGSGRERRARGLPAKRSGEGGRNLLCLTSG